MTTRHQLGRAPIVTSRSPIQPRLPDATPIKWRPADHAAQVRVEDSAAPSPSEEYELCRTGTGDEARYRIRHRVYDEHELVGFRETEPAPENEARALWADLLEGRAR